MITAEIIAVGSELLLGGRTDTNSVFLAGLLAEYGIEVRFKTVVGDDVKDICHAITQASTRTKMIFVTGGLGPTIDDLTREAVAKVTKQPLKLNPQAFRSIKARFKLAGRPITKNQRRQAFLPSESDILRNPAGTAPGFTLRWKHRRLFCLPGVSHEARKMFAESVKPILQNEGLGESILKTQTIHTFGLIEGIVDERIKGIVPVSSGIRLGILASPLGVTISLTEITKNPLIKTKGKSDSTKKPKDLLEFYTNRIISRLGPYVFAFGDQTMEEIIGQHLTERGLTLGLAESCTGGLIGHRLTQVAGSSAYVDRGVVCYSNQAKIDLLGVGKSLIVKHGAVSAQVAKAMARGIRECNGVDLGLSITGIAGPGGGTPHKPVGLVYVGLATHKKTFTKEFQFYGDRNMIKLRSSQGALDVLRRWLLGVPILDS